MRYRVAHRDRDDDGEARPELQRIGALGLRPRSDLTVDERDAEAEHAIAGSRERAGATAGEGALGVIGFAAIPPSDALKAVSGLGAQPKGSAVMLDPTRRPLGGATATPCAILTVYLRSV